MWIQVCENMFITTCDSLIFYLFNYKAEDVKVFAKSHRPLLCNWGSTNDSYQYLQLYNYFASWPWKAPPNIFEPQLDKINAFQSVSFETQTPWNAPKRDRIRPSWSSKLEEMLNTVFLFWNKQMFFGIKKGGSSIPLSKFKFQLYHLLEQKPSAKHLTLPYLSFLIYRMKVTTVPHSYECKINYTDTRKHLIDVTYYYNYCHHNQNHQNHCDLVKNIHVQAPPLQIIFSKFRVEPGPDEAEVILH